MGAASALGKKKGLTDFKKGGKIVGVLSVFVVNNFRRKDMPEKRGTITAPLFRINFTMPSALGGFEGTFGRTRPIPRPKVALGTLVRDFVGPFLLPM